MLELNEQLSRVLKSAFADCGYGENMGNVVPCAVEGFGDFQCNDAMRLSKEFRKNPFDIASEVVEKIKENPVFEKVEVARPGFINLTIKSEFLADFASGYIHDINVDAKPSNNITMMIDYGGPNVAKPLHIGHLRSAIIGESLKRISKYMGYNVLGDVHLGDWGRQMGMVIMGIKRRYPNLPYFDENFDGVYPSECPVDIAELEAIYPEENVLAKNDPQVMEEARIATVELQNGRRGYVELWKSFLKISVDDVKKIYKDLNVDFELWLGESDSHKYIPQLLKQLKDKNLLTESDGASVVNVEREDDKITIPPCIILKSDGGVMYGTTELATILMRKQEFNAKKLLYLTDNRQGLHFTQVFRVAELMGLTKDMELEHIGFGTMNGKDGKPFKTRDGGVLKLSTLIEEVKEKAKSKIRLNDKDMTEEKVNEIVDAVYLATLKFADLSNTVTKDYIFDLDKFSEFEGKTGPYLLYTVTRIKSMLNKCNFDGNTSKIIVNSDIEKQILLNICGFNNVIKNAFNEKSPSLLCDMAYKLANMYSTFYASFNILNESDSATKQSRITLSNYVLITLEKLLYLLGIKTIDKM